MGNECENCGKDCRQGVPSYIVEENHFGGRSFMLCRDCLSRGLTLLNKEKMRGQR